MKKMIKAILLKGEDSQEEIFELSAKNTFEDVYNYFGVNDFGDIEYFSFGEGYIAIWKSKQKDNICMEITCYAGAEFPIFINSEVIIIKESKNRLVDININDVKKYFNTENAFWALMKVKL